jgi:hypothetical protein
VYIEKVGKKSREEERRRVKKNGKQRSTAKTS